MVGIQMRNIGTIALSISALLFAAGIAFAENSVLSEDEAVSLTEQNYRKKISNTEMCIVLFYRSDVKGTTINDDVIKALKESLSKDVSFFKVDLKQFSRQESNYVAKNDIGRKVVPSIVPYKYGFPIPGKVLGPARRKWVDQIVSAYSEEFR
jgi:hypothetical protein